MLKRAEEDDVRRSASGHRDVGIAVAVEITDGETIGRALGVAEANGLEVAARAVVEKHRPGGLDEANDDVDGAVSVHVCDRDGVGVQFGWADQNALTERPVASVEIDEGALADVAHHEVQATVAVEVPGRGGACGRCGRPERRGPVEPGFAVIEVDMALPTVTMGHREIYRPVVVEVTGHDAGSRLGGQFDAQVPWKPSRAVVEAEEAGRQAVGGDHIRKAITIEIGDRGVARIPLRLTPGAPEGKAAMPVIEVDEFEVGRVVADDNVEVAVGIEISQQT